jgi:protein gp37
MNKSKIDKSGEAFPSWERVKALLFISLWQRFSSETSRFLRPVFLASVRMTRLLRGQMVQGVCILFLHLAAEVYAQGPSLSTDLLPRVGEATPSTRFGSRSQIQNSLNLKITNIQWSDSTINPVMGCDGCELWATRSQVIAELKKVLGGMRPDLAELNAKIDGIARRLQHVNYAVLIKQVVKSFVRDDWARKQAVNDVKSILRCYAGILHLYRGGKIAGYAEDFSKPVLFPGRVLEAARWADFRGTCRPDKPWLDGLPRLIFVSDMGDALSRNITFENLLEEIILPVGSDKGSRHVWLWLTKRPARMADFGKWLLQHGGEWPRNLVAMTSVTSRKTLGRIDALRRVPCAVRGLSVEPLFESVNLSLKEINWVIAGGASGTGAEPFELSWARDIQKQCRKSGSAFFLKQLGANAVENGTPLKMRDSHGGDWSEWPQDLRVREMPEEFKALA